MNKIVQINITTHNTIDDFIIDIDYDTYVKFLIDDVSELNVLKKINLFDLIEKFMDERKYLKINFILIFKYFNFDIHDIIMKLIFKYFIHDELLPILEEYKYNPCYVIYNPDYIV